MIAALLVIAASSASATSPKKIGDWTVRCEASQAEEGRIESCLSIRSREGVTISALRDASGMSVTVNIKGCKIKTPVEPQFVEDEALSSDEAKDAFVGAQLRAVVLTNRQCPSRPMVMPFGGSEDTELLNYTAMVRDTGEVTPLSDEQE